MLVHNIHRHVARIVGNAPHAIAKTVALATVNHATVAWATAEVTGHALNAGFLRMPSIGGARMFLLVFALVFAAELFHAGHRNPVDATDHTPEKRIAPIARLEATGEDDRRSPSAALRALRALDAND